MMMELLKKATSIKDILEIQKKTRRIEEEIEARTGRLKYLDDQVRFSTLRLTLQKKTAYESAPRNYLDQLTNAFKNGVDAFLDFTLFLVSIWPFLVLLALLWLFRNVEQITFDS